MDKQPTKIQIKELKSCGYTTKGAKKAFVNIKRGLADVKNGRISRINISEL